MKIKSQGTRLIYFTINLLLSAFINNPKVGDPQMSFLMTLTYNTVRFCVPTLDSMLPDKMSVRQKFGNTYKVVLEYGSFIFYCTEADNKTN